MSVGGSFVCVDGEIIVKPYGVDGVDFFNVLYLCRWYVSSLLYRNLIASYLC